MDNTHVPEKDKGGRPAIYNDPVDKFTRIERETLEWLRKRYAHASDSRCIAMAIDDLRAMVKK